MEKLYLGVSRRIITPEIGGQLYGYRPDIRSTSVEDDLNVTVFYFSQGECRALMLCATVCVIQTALAQQIITQVSQITGISQDNILLSATHTHSGPNTGGTVGWGDLDHAYCRDIFIPAILSAAQEAVENTKSVTMYAARGKSYVGVNRRQLLPNSNRAVFGQNPWGAFCPHMTVLSFKDEQGATVANLIHYGCHGTAAGANTEITRDWPGIMTDALEAATGGITAFFNGAEGDIGPRLTNGDTVGDITHVHELGQRAAADALRIYVKAEEQKEVALLSKAFDVHIPLKPRMEKAEAEKMLDQYRGETVNIKGTLRNYAERILAAYEDAVPQQTHFVFRQGLVQLGSFVFTSYPFELFSEIAMRVDDAFPEKNILALSLTNGTENYFATEDALCRGGYEVEMYRYGHDQSYEENADLRLVMSAVENVKQL